MKTVFNLEALVMVKIRDKEPCYYLTYKPFRKSFWGNTLEGYHDIFSEDVYNGYELQNGKYRSIKLLIENNTAYFKPYVTLAFVGEDIKTTKTFETYEDALIWGREQASKGINVQLEFNAE